MLSASVSSALAVFGGEEVEETSRFALMFDKFFDALNVHNYDHGHHARKEFQDPYVSAKDKRLKVNLLQQYHLHFHLRMYKFSG